LLLNNKFKILFVVTIIAIAFVVVINYLPVHPQLISTKHKDSDVVTVAHENVEQPVHDNAQFITSTTEKHLLLAKQNRLKDMLSSCEKNNIEAQYSFIEKKLSNIAIALQNSDKLKARFNSTIITGTITDKNRSALFDYVVEKPYDKVAYKSALKECDKHINLPQCKSTLFSLNNMPDTQNAATLLDIASIALKQGNEEKAHLAIELAAKTANFNEYFFEYIQRSQEIIASNAFIGFNQSLIISIGRAAAVPSSFSTIFKFCKDSHNVSDILVDACGKIGEVMEHHSHSYISQALGQALQENYFRQTNNQKALEQTQQRRKRLNNAYNTSLFNQVSQLIQFDEKLARLWLTTGLALGESQSQDIIIKEIDTLIENPDYSPCQITFH